MVRRAGRTRVSLGNVDEGVLEEIIHEPGLHPLHIQEHEQEQNDFYAAQEDKSMLEVLMRGADPPQVRSPGGWTEAGTPYGNGATFGQSSNHSPAYQAVRAASADELKTMGGGKPTPDAATAVVQARAGTVEQRLRLKFGDRIERVQAMAPNHPKTVHPTARDMADALVELSKSERSSEEA
jgi:hypothetical protein